MTARQTPGHTEGPNVVGIIREQGDVTKAQLWEAYRDMVERYEDALSRLSDRATCATELLAALTMLHDNLAEYQRNNHLGGYDNQDMKQARAAMAKART